MSMCMHTFTSMQMHTNASIPSLEWQNTIPDPRKFRGSKPGPSPVPNTSRMCLNDQHLWPADIHSFICYCGYHQFKQPQEELKFKPTQMPNPHKHRDSQQTTHYTIDISGNFSWFTGQLIFHGAKYHG